MSDEVKDAIEQAARAIWPVDREDLARFFDALAKEETVLEMMWSEFWRVDLAGRERMIAALKVLAEKCK